MSPPPAQAVRAIPYGASQRNWLVFVLTALGFTNAQITAALQLPRGGGQISTAVKGRFTVVKAIRARNIPAAVAKAFESGAFSFDVIGELPDSDMQAQLESVMQAVDHLRSNPLSADLRGLLHELAQHYEHYARIHPHVLWNPDSPFTPLWEYIGGPKSSMAIITAAIAAEQILADEIEAEPVNPPCYLPKEETPPKAHDKPAPTATATTGKRSGSTGRTGRSGISVDATYGLGEGVTVRVTARELPAAVAAELTAAVVAAAQRVLAGQPADGPQAPAAPVAAAPMPAAPPASAPVSKPAPRAGTVAVAAAMLAAQAAAAAAPAPPAPAAPHKPTGAAGPPAAKSDAAEPAAGDSVPTGPMAGSDPGEPATAGPPAAQATPGGASPDQPGPPAASGPPGPPQANGFDPVRAAALMAEVTVHLASVGDPASDRDPADAPKTCIFPDKLVALAGRDLEFLRKALVHGVRPEFTPSMRAWLSLPPDLQPSGLATLRAYANGGNVSSKRSQGLLKDVREAYKTGESTDLAVLLAMLGGRIMPARS